MNTLEIVSIVIGWIYFGAWSLSFYGQLYTNWKIKRYYYLISVEGMNFDFVILNFSGFTFYSVYVSYGFFINSDSTGNIQLNDVIFAYHALLITLLTIGQIFIYPVHIHNQKGNNKVRRIVWILVAFYWVSFVHYYNKAFKVVNPRDIFSVIAFMGYYKLSITFLKYLPQVYWNYKRKSTKGWSIFNIILDFTGGFFSFAQIIVDKIRQNDLNLSPVKLVLGVMAMVYDIIFIIQHYIIYPQNKGIIYMQNPDQPIRYTLVNQNQSDIKMQKGNQNINTSQI